MMIVGTAARPCGARMNLVPAAMLLAGCEGFLAPPVVGPASLEAIPDSLFILSGLESETVEFQELNTPEVECCAGVVPCSVNSHVVLSTIRAEPHGAPNPFGLDPRSFVALTGSTIASRGTVAFTWGNGGLSPHVPDRVVRTQEGDFSLAEFENTCPTPIPFDVAVTRTTGGNWFDDFFVATIYEDATCLALHDGDDGDSEGPPADPEAFAQRCFTPEVWALALQRLDAGCAAADEACPLE